MGYRVKQGVWQQECSTCEGAGTIEIEDRGACRKADCCGGCSHYELCPAGCDEGWVNAECSECGESGLAHAEADEAPWGGLVCTACARAQKAGAA